MDDLRPPICIACGVTMVAAALSGQAHNEGDEQDWICVECEETGDDER